jgi:ribosomal protein S18 acetylase RimI-like enzyme
VNPPVELRRSIDREWLEAAAEREPVEHAYALWDLDRYPDRIRVVSAVRNGVTIGYLLIWEGLPGTAIVHWHGTGPGTEQLATALPSRPLVAIVPPEARDPVLATRGAGREYAELMAVRPLRPLPEVPAADLRRLVGSDGRELHAWAARQHDPQAAEYPGLDPDLEAIWGAFRDGRLVGAARAAVRLPREWIVAGVFVEPDARRSGVGRRLVASIVSAANGVGARVGLYVREDRAAARRLYDRLGFVPIARRLWLDLGTGLEP